MPTEPAGGVPPHEKLALAVAGVACGVYLLHSLPTILFPTGFLASVLTLVAGVLLGLAGAVGALVLAFYRLTKSAPSSSSDRAAVASAQQLQPGGSRGRRVAPGSTSAATAPGPTLPHAIALRGEFSGIVYTAPASAWRRPDTILAWPPTCDPSQPCRAWEASLAQGTLVLRPLLLPPGAKPPSPGRSGSGVGASAAASAVAAADSAGQADKARSLADAAAAASTSADAAGGAPTAQTVALAAAAAPTKVGIPLEGCTVELVADGLNGRSEWIRRAPLLVRHPKWNLLEGEPAFYLWADDPASKQQWLHALGWWCQDSERLEAIDAMYRAYCQAMRDRSNLEYAELAPLQRASGAVGLGASEEAGSSGSTGGELQAVAQGAGSSGGGGKRGWKGWGASKVQTMRRRMQERRGKGAAGSGGTADSQDGEAADGLGSAVGSPSRAQRGSLPPSAAGSPAKLPEAVQDGLSADLQSLESIMEAKWMQSRKIQVPPVVSEAVERTRSRPGSRPGSLVSSPKVIPRPSSASAGIELPGSLPASTAYGNGSMGSSLPSEGFITPSLGTSPAVGSLQPLAAGSGGRQADVSLLPGASPGKRGLPPLPPGGQPQAAQQAAGGGAQQAAAADIDVGTALPAAKPGEAPSGLPSALPEGLPPLLSPDYAFNAFVTRVAFDLLRRPDFQEHLRSRIQRQLSRIQRPDYITSLEVVGVDAGGAAPTLCNLRGLPQPEASIWPQVLFDMRYQGAFTVTIEMKVDIRDAAAWGRLDSALTRLADGGRGSSSGKPQHPQHAASAPVLRGGGAGGGGVDDFGDEDVEGSDGDFPTPGSPDSSANSQAASAAGRSAPGDRMAAVVDAAMQQRGGDGKPRSMLGGIRLSAAKKLRQLAESTAQHISRIPLRLSLTFSLLEGTMCAWVPPPPGNRLFYSFVAPPTLELSARPELAGRLLKYSYHIARVSSWIEQRMRHAIRRNMVFPGGGDILLAPLMALEHPNAADGLPSLGRYVQQQAAVAAAAAAAKEEEEQEEGGEARAQQEAEKRTAAEDEAEAGEGRGAAAAAAEQRRPAGDGDAQAEEVLTQRDAAAPLVAVAEVALAEPGPAAKGKLGAPGAGVAAATAADHPALSGAATVGAQDKQQQGQQPEEVAQAGAEPPKAAASAPAAAADVRDAVQRQQQLPAQEEMQQQQQQQQQQQRRSSQEELLLGEPSLSALPGSQQAAATAAAAAVGAERAVASQPADGGGGHLISPQYDGQRASSIPEEEGADEGGAAAVPAPPDFRVHGRGGEGEPQGRSAADAWEEAMAQEARASEAPTPRFASQLWQQAPAPLAAGLATQRQPQQGTGPASEAASALPLRRPSLQLKLSATRSLDPDFTRSAEHTGFGESPPDALPNYRSGSSAVRRTLSARSSDGGGGMGVAAAAAAAAPPSAPGSARGREAVGAAISRSLDKLRRQGSSLKQQQGQEAAAHAGQVMQRQEQQEGQRPAGQPAHADAAQGQHSSPPQQEQPGQGRPTSPPQQQQQQQHSPPQLQQHSPGSSQEGGSPLPGDPRRLRQHGSIKEQAGKFFTRMNAAGKAFASQVQDMQQQRAASRLAHSPLSNGGSSFSSGGGSFSDGNGRRGSGTFTGHLVAGPSTGGSSLERTASQHDAL